VTKAHVADGSMTVEALCAAAVEVSDNTAANLLLASIGGRDGYNGFARSIGDRFTQLDRTEPALNEALPGDTRDCTTPHAMARDVEVLLLGTALRTASRALLESWLLQSQTGAARLRAGLPASWRTGDKTGTGERGTSNDVAITWPPDRAPLTVAAYLTGATVDGDGRDAALASVARFRCDGSVAAFEGQRGIAVLVDEIRHFFPAHLTRVSQQNRRAVFGVALAQDATALRWQHRKEFLDIPHADPHAADNARVRIVAEPCAGNVRPRHEDRFDALAAQPVRQAALVERDQRQRGEFALPESDTHGKQDDQRKDGVAESGVPAKNRLHGEGYGTEEPENLDDGKLAAAMVQHTLFHAGCIPDRRSKVATPRGLPTWKQCPVGARPGVAIAGATAPGA
jgi:beta-lactamase class A